MHVIFAESIDGGILLLLAVVVCIGTSLLALGALAPASKGNRPVTLVLAAPALTCGLLITAYVAYGFVTDGLHDPDYELRDFMLPWAFTAGPALATSLLAAFVLWLKRTRTN